MLNYPQSQKRLWLWIVQIQTQKEKTIILKFVSIMFFLDCENVVKFDQCDTNDVKIENEL